MKSALNNGVFLLYRFSLFAVLMIGFGGCHRSRTPIFIVQTSLVSHGNRGSLKQAFGEYRYFRNTGWHQVTLNGRPAVIAIAKPDIDRILSAIRTRESGDETATERFKKNEQKYTIYLTTVNYDFAFYVDRDETVAYGGVTVREFVEAGSSTKNYAPDEQASMIKTIAENTFPTWVEQDMKQKLLTE